MDKIKSSSFWTSLGNLGWRVSYHWSSLRLRLSNYWSWTDRTVWVFCGAFGLAIAALALLINTSIEQSAAAIEDRAIHRDLTCLARNVYYEARGEPEIGKLAVAKVTLNRVASKRFPDTICDVVYEQRWDRRRERYVGAFAWTEFDTVKPPTTEGWQTAWQVAETVYQNPETVQLKGALFYHATRIKPSWAKKKKRIQKIGRHIFYR